MRPSATGNQQIPDSRRAKRRRGNAQSGSSSCIWINSQIVAKSDSGCSLEELAQTVAKFLPMMNLVNLTTSAHRMAKMVADDSCAQAHMLREIPVFKQVCHAIADTIDCERAEDIKPQALSNVAWALATARYVDIQAIQLIIQRALQILPRFKPFELSTMLWATAKLSKLEPGKFQVIPMKQFFDASAAYMMDARVPISFRCFSMIVWAFATAKQRHNQLFANFAIGMIRKIHEADSQELANTTWAYATLGLNDTDFYHSLAEKAISNLESFKPQELSSMLWGFATSGFYHENFFLHAALVAQSKVLHSQHLANVFWAYSNACPRQDLNRHLMLSILPQCIHQVCNFKAEELSIVAFAVSQAFGDSSGTMEELPPLVARFFDSAIALALAQLDNFSVQSLLNITKAIVQLGLIDSELVTIVGTEVVHRANMMNSSEVLKALQGFLHAASRDSHSAKLTAGALAAEIKGRIDSLNRQDAQILSRICTDFFDLPQTPISSRRELCEYCFRIEAICSADCSSCDMLNVDVISSISTQIGIEDAASHGGECESSPSYMNTYREYPSWQAHPRSLSRMAVKDSFFQIDEDDSQMWHQDRDHLLPNAEACGCAAQMSFHDEDDRESLADRSAAAALKAICISAPCVANTHLVVKNGFFQVEDWPDKMQRSVSAPCL